MHSDMDSLILYNAEICSKTDDKVLKSAQGRSINGESTAQDLVEVIYETNIQGKPYELQNPNLPTKIVSKTPDASCNQEIPWCLEFDGSINKLGARAGIWVHNMQNDPTEGHAYRLNFRCTNNMAEYEALLLGLKLIKSLGATRISIIGDSDLIIQ